METSSSAQVPPPARRGAATLALAGGAVAIAGVFLEWARVVEFKLASDRLSSLLSELGGTALRPEDLGLPSLSSVGGPADLAYAGRSDWTGFLAALAGLVVAVGAVLAIMVAGRDMRRLGGLLAVAGGAAVVLLAVVAFFGVERIVRDGLGADLRREIDAYLSIPFLGGLVDRVIDGVLGAFDITARAPYGLYVTAAGGLLAVAAGAVVLREPGPVVRGRRVHGALARTVASLDPADRGALLEVLTAPPERREELAARFYGTPGKESWRAIIDELSKDERSRQDIVEAIRKVEGG